MGSTESTPKIVDNCTKTVESSDGKNWLKHSVIPGYSFVDGSFFSDALVNSVDSEQLTAINVLDKVYAVFLQSDTGKMDLNKTSEQITKHGFSWKSQNTYMVENKVCRGRLTSSQRKKLDHIDIHILPRFQEHLASMTEFDRKQLEDLKCTRKTYYGFTEPDGTCTEVDAGSIWSYLGMRVFLEPGAETRLEQEEKASITFKVYTSEKSKTGILVSIKNYIGKCKRIAEANGTKTIQSEEQSIELATLKYFMPYSLIGSMDKTQVKKSNAGFLKNIMAAVDAKG